jgi:hypothetical protein
MEVWASGVAEDGDGCCRGVWARVRASAAERENKERRGIEGLKGTVMQMQKETRAAGVVGRGRKVVWEVLGSRGEVRCRRRPYAVEHRDHVMYRARH